MCSVEGCHTAIGPHGAKGLCSKHYKRLAKHGSVVLPVREIPKCTLCDEVAKARGLCGTHYQRWRKHGDPKHDGQRTLEERLWARVVKQPSGCWEWQGHKLRGYGQIGLSDRRIGYTHRVAWEITYGPIADGLHVCHRCDNPACCNPEHLFLGDMQDNITDMISKGRGAWQDGVPWRRGHFHKKYLRAKRRLRSNKSDATAEGWMR